MSDPHASVRRLDIQGLRAVAVLAVVAYHAGLPLPGGFVGVDMFFVISGYVITAMLQREWDATGRIDFGRFFLRRFRRLIPALSLLLTVTMLLALLFSGFSTLETIADTAVAALLISANVGFARAAGDYFAAGLGVSPLLHIWSLSVEEQFYLAFPPLLVLSWVGARRLPRLSRLPLPSLALIALPSLALALLSAAEMTLPIPRYLYSFYSPLTRAWEFAVGALLVLLPATWTQLSRAASLVSGVLGAVLTAGSLVLISGERAVPLGWTPFPGPEVLVPVFGTALLILAGRQVSPLSRLLSLKPLTLVGDWSYSLYLWHWPLIVFARQLWPDVAVAPQIAAALSIVPALLSFFLLEQPLRRQTVSRLRPLVLITMMVVVLPIALFTAIRELPRSTRLPPAVQALYAQMIAVPEYNRRGCHLTDVNRFIPEEWARCVWHQDGTAAPVYLIGDSHARHFADGVMTAAGELGRPTTALTTSSCSPIEGLTVWRADAATGAFVPEQNLASCSAYIDFVYGQLRRSPPGLVILSAAHRMWRHASPAAVALNDGEPTTLPAHKLQLFTEGMDATVRMLQAAGHQVLLVKPVPPVGDIAPKWDPRQCSLVMLIRATCRTEVPLASVEALYGELWAAVDGVAEQTGSGRIDFRDWICPADVCRSERDGILLYRDTHHLTAAAGRALAPRWVEAMQALDGSTCR